jgi:hypothetical protein
MPRPQPPCICTCTAQCASRSSCGPGAPTAAPRPPPPRRPPSAAAAPAATAPRPARAAPAAPLQTQQHRRCPECIRSKCAMQCPSCPQHPTQQHQAAAVQVFSSCSCSRHILTTPNQCTAAACTDAVATCWQGGAGGGRRQHQGAPGAPLQGIEQQVVRHRRRAVLPPLHRLGCRLHWLDHLHSSELWRTFRCATCCVGAVATGNGPCWGSMQPRSSTRRSCATRAPGRRGPAW